MKFFEIKSEDDFEAHFQSETWLTFAAELCRTNRILFSQIRRLNSSDHIVFALDNFHVLKIYRPYRRSFEREIKALEFIAEKTVLTVPKVIRTGEFADFEYVLMSRLRGATKTRQEWLKLERKAQLKFVEILADGLRRIHALDASSFQDNWTEFIRDRAESFIARQIKHGVNERVIKALPQFIEKNFPLVPTEPTVFMHSDIHFGNICFEENTWTVSGLCDFGDSRRGFHEYDFVAIGVLILQGQGELQRAFFRAYGYAGSDINEEMQNRLMMLTMLYESADLRRYAMRLKPEAVFFSLDELKNGIWNFVS